MKEGQRWLTGYFLDLQAAARSTSRSRLVLTAVTLPLRPASVRTPLPPSSKYHMNVKRFGLFESWVLFGIRTIGLR